MTHKLADSQNLPAPDRGVLTDTAEVFQLLSTPGRLHLLWILSTDEVDVTTLTRAVGGTKAAISQHLAKLRLAGWIDGRKDGRRVLYRVTDPHIVTLIHQAVEHILEQRAAQRPRRQRSQPAAATTARMSARGRRQAVTLG
jgi:DNA-binding transcriptional ArsR family regulator